MAADASSSIDRYAYQVFLSFRGEDTRKHFTDHLYTALINAGIRTFRDDDEIPRGEDIKSVLINAIQQSRSSLIVMSKDYASSGWCLDELSKIVERMTTSKHIVIPVFYDVDPSDVGMQTNCVGVSFKKHEDRIKAETDEEEKKKLKENVEGWKQSLRKIADLEGMDLHGQADR